MKQWLLLVFITISTGFCENNEEEATQYIEKVYKESEKRGIKLNCKQWEYDTADKTTKDEKKKEFEKANKEYDEYQDYVTKTMNSYDWKKLKNPKTRRMFSYIALTGESALPLEKQTRLSEIKDEIIKINATAAVRDCKSSDPTPKLKYKDVRERVTKDNKNIDEVKCFWKEWHDILGAPSKPLFTELMAIENEAGCRSGYENVAKYWQDQYGIKDFVNTMGEWYRKVLPLYQQLHAYVRFKLKKSYGKGHGLEDPDGLINTVFLGFMGNQGPLHELLTPFPNKPSEHDISDALKAQKYSSTKIARTAENYFVSLGFSRLPQDFWDQSVFEEKEDVDCSNYNSYNIKKCTYRAMFCAKPTTNDFLVMHYFIGSIEYQGAYCYQPYFFQMAPNVIDYVFAKLFMDLAKSPTYLKSLGLLDQNSVSDKELELNILLREAMLNVFWLPFFYAYDLWRWKVAEGKITPEHYNCEFWKIWSNLQGVKPPVHRSENNLDVAINPGFLTGEQYIPYFMRQFSKYFIIRSLCETSGFYDPKNKPNNLLMHCDISHSKEAGTKLKVMMKLGDSSPLSVVLERLTGKKKIDPSAMEDYYKPLLAWLKGENKKNNEVVGWHTEKSGKQSCY